MILHSVRPSWKFIQLEVHGLAWGLEAYTFWVQKCPKQICRMWIHKNWANISCCIYIHNTYGAIYPWFVSFCWWSLQCTGRCCALAHEQSVEDPTWERYALPTLPVKTCWSCMHWTAPEMRVKVSTIAVVPGIEMPFRLLYITKLSSYRNGTGDGFFPPVAADWCSRCPLFQIYMNNPGLIYFVYGGCFGFVFSLPVQTQGSLIPLKYMLFKKYWNHKMHQNAIIYMLPQHVAICSAARMPRRWCWQFCCWLGSHAGNLVRLGDQWALRPTWTEVLKCKFHKNGWHSIFFRICTRWPFVSLFVWAHAIVQKNFHWIVFPVLRFLMVPSSVLARGSCLHAWNMVATDFQALISWIGLHMQKPVLWIQAPTL